MGCFGSRLDKRASAASEDLNSVGLQFVGGEGDQDLQAADEFVMQQGKDKKYECLQKLYPTEAGKATDDTKAKAAFTEAFKFVEKLLKEHTDKSTTEQKVEMVLGKYKRSDCVLQLTNVMASFKKTGIEVAEEAKVLTPEEQKKADDDKAKAAMEAGMMEGGEEGGMGGMEGMGDAKVDAGMMSTVTDPRSAHVDDQEFEGAANTPAMYLRNALVNEYFGDLIKQRIVQIQFMKADGLKTNEGLAGAAGFLTSGLATTAEKPSTEAWFSGLVGELDEAAFSELKKGGAISFPGWVQGWANKADADAYLKTMQADAAKKDVKAVIVHVTEAPSITVLGNRIVCHRLSGELIDDVTSAAGITTVNVKAKVWDERSAQAAWDASVAVVKELTEEEKKAAADAAAAKKVEDDKAAAAAMEAGM